MVSFHPLDSDGHIRIEFGRLECGMILSMKFKPNEKPDILLSKERHQKMKDYLLYDDMAVIKSVCACWGDVPMSCRKLIYEWISIRLDGFVQYQIHQGDTSMAIFELEELLNETLPWEVSEQIKMCMKKLI